MTPDDIAAEVAAQNEQLVRAYHVCFSSVAGQAVLADLVLFCRGAESCAVPGDHDRTLLLLGRHETLLRIQKFAKLNEDEILQLRLGRIQPKPTDEGEQ